MIANPHIVSNFRGGMRMNDDPTKLGEGEYYFLSNGRFRNKGLIPTRLPVKDTNIPSGRIQALVGYGSVLVMMINGKVWYRDYATQERFFESVQFAEMSASLPVWTEVVPASSVNFIRKGSGTGPEQNILFTDPFKGSPRCLIFQNGYEYPRLLFNNGETRLAGKLDTWRKDTPEYVPVMKQMYYHPGNGVLYGVSADGLRIYRSVAGQPLNFVIAIDNNGDRFADNAYEEEAERLSWNVSYNPITCIKGLNYKSDTLEEDPPIFVGTDNGSFAVFPKYDFMMYGESTFRNIDLFSVGPLNQDSFVEMFGDFGFISSRGIHSFNAVSQFRNEGKSSPFYLAVESLFKVGNTSVVQDDVCVGSFDNYTLFAVNTKYGRGILVYDPVIGVFVSFDIYPEIGQVIKFAEIQVGTTRRLFCYDVANNLFELFAGNTSELLFYPREWKTGHHGIEQRIHKVSVAVSDIRSNGNLTITEYFDTKKGEVKTTPLTANVPSNSLPMTPPYGTSTADTIRQIQPRMEKSKRGWKIGTEIRLTADAEIQEIQVVPEVFTEENPQQEQAGVYAGQTR
jgi:hypothetical protein